MRLVLDTNVVVAGLLWLGPPRRLMDHAIEGRFELCSSTVLIEELTRTLGYSKFAQRMAQHETNVTTLVAQYQALTYLLMPSHIPRVVPRDADDDHVVACVVAAQADMIVTGDRHLLELERFRGISIIKPAEALEFIGRYPPTAARPGGR